MLLDSGAQISLIKTSGAKDLKPKVHTKVYHVMVQSLEDHSYHTIQLEFLLSVMKFPL